MYPELVLIRHGKMCRPGGSRCEGTISVAAGFRRSGEQGTPRRPRREHQGRSDAEGNMDKHACCGFRGRNR